MRRRDRGAGTEGRRDGGTEDKARAGGPGALRCTAHVRGQEGADGERPEDVDLNHGCGPVQPRGEHTDRYQVLMSMRNARPRAELQEDKVGWVAAIVTVCKRAQSSSLQAAIYQSPSSQSPPSLLFSADCADFVGP